MFADLVHDDLVECHEHLLDAQVSFSAGKLSRPEGELCLQHRSDKAHEELGVQSIVVLSIRLVQVTFTFHDAEAFLDFVPFPVCPKHLIRLHLHRGHNPEIACVLQHRIDAAAVDRDLPDCLLLPPRLDAEVFSVRPSQASIPVLFLPFEGLLGIDELCLYPAFFLGFLRGIEIEIDIVVIGVRTFEGLPLDSCAVQSHRNQACGASDEGAVRIQVVPVHVACLAHYGKGDSAVAEISYVCLAEVSSVKYEIVPDILFVDVQVVEERLDSGYAVVQISDRAIEGIVEYRHSALAVVEVSHVDLRKALVVLRLSVFGGVAARGGDVEIGGIDVHVYPFLCLVRIGEAVLQERGTERVDLVP